MACESVVLVCHMHRIFIPATRTYYFFLCIFPCSTVQNCFPNFGCVLCVKTAIQLNCQSVFVVYWKVTSAAINQHFKTFYFSDSFYLFLDWLQSCKIRKNGAWYNKNVIHIQFSGKWLLCSFRTFRDLRSRRFHLYIKRKNLSALNSKAIQMKVDFIKSWL